MKEFILAGILSATLVSQFSTHDSGTQAKSETSSTASLSEVVELAMTLEDTKVVELTVLVDDGNNCFRLITSEIEKSYLGLTLTTTCPSGTTVETAKIREPYFDVNTGISNVLSYPGDTDIDINTLESLLKKFE